MVCLKVGDINAKNLDTRSNLICVYTVCEWIYIDEGYPCKYFLYFSKKTHFEDTLTLEMAHWDASNQHPQDNLFMEK